MSNALPVVAFDTETGGLTAAVCALLEVAVVVASADGTEVYSRDGWRVLPARGTVVDGAAAAINGYEPTEWNKHALPEAEALWQLAEVLPEHFTLVAHNLSFDRKFLAAACARQQWPDVLRGARQEVCTLALSRKLLVKQGRISSAALDAVTHHLGVTVAGPPHRALPDAERALGVYRELRKITHGSDAVALEAP